MSDTLTFTKLSGAGNDFVLIDLRSPETRHTFESRFCQDGITFTKNSKEARRCFVRKVATRSRAIGADGVLFIEQATESSVDFKWDFYNSDGSSAAMCGNAARCVAQWALQNDFSRRVIKFETSAGKIEAEGIDRGNTKIFLARPLQIERKKIVKISSGEAYEGTLINSGVPHFVLEVPNLSESQTGSIARDLRKTSDFGPQGANITFMSETSFKSCDAVTFERGVEAFTMACGTGAIAAASVIFERHGVKQINVSMPGGVLEIEFFEEKKQVSLAGEALVLYVGKLNQEALL